jgi:UPF0755 protein
MKHKKKYKDLELNLITKRAIIFFVNRYREFRSVSSNLYIKVKLYFLKNKFINKRDSAFFVKINIIKKKHKDIIFLLTFSLVFIFMIIYSSVFDMLQPLDYNGKTKEKIIEILPGKNTSQIARLLKHEKLIKNEKVLIIYAKIKGLDSKLKAGKYILHPAMSIPEIVKDLSEGNVLNESIRFTIPEGLELKEIAELLEKKGLVDSEYFIEIAKVKNFPFDFLKGLPGDTTLEGYLFPDTYEVNKDIGEKDIIKIMLRRFENIFNADFVSRARELRLSVHEVITLASIIEREAKVDDERPLISSVFHNRLKIGKLLQSCATVQYALGERKETLLFKDLEIDSPYNTYKVPGLPPGPISNPGEASIKAALFPAETDYLYFVSNGDGTHTFSRTYGEHLRIINRNN